MSLSSGRFLLVAEGSGNLLPGAKQMIYPFFFFFLHLDLALILRTCEERKKNVYELCIQVRLFSLG